MPRSARAQHRATTRRANGESVALGPNESTGAIDCNADLVLDDADVRTGTDCWQFGTRTAILSRATTIATGASRRRPPVDHSTSTGTWVTSRSPRSRHTRRSSACSPRTPRRAPPRADPQRPSAPRPTTFTQQAARGGGSDAFRWLVGGFYFDNDVDGHYLLDLTNLGFVFFDVRSTPRSSQSIAGFGQLEFDLSDQFTVIAGARWSNDQKSDYLNIDESGLFEFFSSPAPPSPSTSTRTASAAWPSTTTIRGAGSSAPTSA